MYFVDADLSRINKEALLISFEEVLIENRLLKNKIINGTKKQSKNRSVENLSNLRDNFLIDLQKLLLKYKI